MRTRFHEERLLPGLIRLLFPRDRAVVWVEESGLLQPSQTFSSQRAGRAGTYKALGLSSTG